MNALALRGDEGRGTLRKATGRCEQPVTRRFPNGETHLQKSEIQKLSAGFYRLGGFCILASEQVFDPEYIGIKSKPGELKHLSTRRKGHQQRLR